MPINYTKSNYRKIYMWKMKSYFYKDLVTYHENKVYKAIKLSIDTTPDSDPSSFKYLFEFTNYIENKIY